MHRGAASCATRSAASRRSSRACARTASCASPSTARLRDLGEEITLDAKQRARQHRGAGRSRARRRARRDSASSEAVELAYKLAAASCSFDGGGQGFDWLASEKLVCVETRRELSGSSRRARFSFNSPEGACPTCGGLGSHAGVRRRARGARCVAVAARGRHRGLGSATKGRSTSASSPRSSRPSRSISTSPGASCPRPCRSACCSATSPRRRSSRKRRGQGVMPRLKRRSERVRRASARRPQTTWRRARLPRGGAAPLRAREPRVRTARARRLSPLARHVTVARRDAAGLVARPLARAAGRSSRARRSTGRAAERGCAAAARHPLARSARCVGSGARLPLARSQRGHAFGRRDRAHSAGHADRLGPGRCALRARRAVGGPARARQRAADRAAFIACATRATRCSWSSTTRPPSARPTT